MKTPWQSINFGVILSDDIMMLKVKAFGITKDIVGGREIMINATGQTVAALRLQLNLTYPPLVKLRSLLIAVNNGYAEDQVVLKDTDEIALIPPVSGG